MRGMSKRSCRYCARCQLHWPYHPDYSRCPACTMATALKTVDKDKVMSIPEAKRRVAHIRFDEWVKNESEFDKAARKARANEELEEELERRSKASLALRDRFSLVIEGAGFTRNEVEQCKAVERAMPLTNNPRYVDPLAE